MNAVSEIIIVFDTMQSMFAKSTMKVINIFANEEVYTICHLGPGFSFICVIFSSRTLMSIS